MFFGKAIAQEYLPDVNVPCPEGNVCTYEVYRWTIRVNKIVSGKFNEKIVMAARVQHGEFIFATKHEALYVIHRIDSEEKRKLLGADYWLDEYSPPEPMVLYCVSDANKYHEIEESDHIIDRFRKSNCYVRWGETKVDESPRKKPVAVRK